MLARLGRKPSLADPGLWLAVALAAGACARRSEPKRDVTVDIAAPPKTSPRPRSAAPIASTRPDELSLEGMVEAAERTPVPSAGKPKPRGKTFHGVFLNATDGKQYVLDYASDSPFRELDGAEVTARGEIYVPKYQALVNPHFRVRRMAIKKPSPDHMLVAIEEERTFEGSFDETTFTAGSKLAGEHVPVFKTTSGKTYFLSRAPEPPLPPPAKRVSVVAHEVEPSPFLTRPGGPYLWVRHVKASPPSP